VRIQDPLRVQQPLDAAHQVHRILAVLEFGEVALQGTQSVLGRDRSAQFDRIPEDPGRSPSHQRALLVGEEDRRVEVAVALRDR